MPEQSRYLYENRALAELAGYTVDRTCYPWVAYVGPRFKPDRWGIVPTDIEARLVHFARCTVRYAGNSGDDRLAEEARKALAAAETYEV